MLGDLVEIKNRPILRVNSKANNVQSSCYNTSCANIKPLKQDTVSFKGAKGILKKADFNGTDLAVIEKYKPNIQQFKTKEDLQIFAEQQIKELKRKDFGGRQEETKIQRKTMLQEWFDYVTKGNEAYSNTQRLIILAAITKDLKANNDKIPPVLNKGVLADTVSELEERLKTNSKQMFDFNKMYQNKLRMAFTGDTFTGETITGWVVIPSKVNDPENFEKNVEKLKTLSHRNWCTKSFNAEPYLAEGDFHVYLENGTPKLGVRFVKDKIREIQSEANNGIIPITYYEVFRDYSKDKNFKLTSNAKTQIARAENVKKNAAKIRKKLGDSPNIKSIDDARLVLNALGIKIIEDTSIETKFLDFLGVNKNKDTDKLLCIESYEAYRSEITCKDLGIKENDLFKYIEEIQHYLSLRDSDLTDLGSLKKIGGNLTVANSNIQSLGKLEYIGGNADFENSKIRNTGALKKINCSCTFNNSEIEDLGDLEYIGGLLNLKDTQIKQLKNLKYIGSDLCLNGSKVEDFGELKYVGGNVVTDYGSAQRKLLTNAGIEIKGYVLG